MRTLFHEVRAIRLTPVDSGRMNGRDGMLAHSYMHGPKGQSTGWRKPTLGGIARITERVGGLLRIKDADERMAVENAA